MGVIIVFIEQWRQLTIVHQLQWFKFMGSRLSDRDIQKRLDACSRHRQDVRELPSTPEGFWVPYFEDTQPQQPVPVGDPALIAYRLRNRQQVLDESMHY